MHSSVNEQQIITMVLQGRKEAFAILVDRYQNYVFSLALRYLPRREEAEEAAQDVFIKAYGALASFRGESRFSTWLYRITHTTCISWLRKKQVVHIPTDASFVHELPDTQSEHTALRAEQRSKAAMLEKAISRLNAEDAQVITLFYQGEQSLEEIALILGMPANTIKVKLHRARHKLRDILTRLFPQEIKEFSTGKDVFKKNAHE